MWLARTTSSNTPPKPGKVTVPHPKKDLPLATARNIHILKQAGL